MVSSPDISSSPPPKRPRRRIPPGLLRRVDAARFCGIGCSTFDRLTAAGLTPAPIRLGGSVLWCRAELAEWCRHGCPDRSTWTPIWAAIRAARRAGRSK